ncbi:hypothetical protein B0O99DRAFT_45752 [Bisporella sp. PMI_857]|nr:hypothetical protein B0O99DRAFT_45752 [Bisporella sp. PMI_857]
MQISLPILLLIAGLASVNGAALPQKEKTPANNPAPSASKLSETNAPARPSDSPKGSKPEEKTDPANNGECVPIKKDTKGRENRKKDKVATKKILAQKKIPKEAEKKGPNGGAKPGPDAAKKPDASPAPEKPEGGSTLQVRDNFKNMVDLLRRQMDTLNKELATLNKVDDEFDALDKQIDELEKKYKQKCGLKPGAKGSNDKKPAAKESEGGSIKQEIKSVQDKLEKKKAPRATAKKAVQDASKKVVEALQYFADIESSNQDYRLPGEIAVLVADAKYFTRLAKDDLADA